MNITDCSATEMARRIRLKEISPVEVVDAHLRRIAELNLRLNAFVTVREKEARQEAREAEAAVMRGGDKPLLGVPISIKSSIDVAGLRCEAGSRLRRGYVAENDAPLVRRLKNAGAIVLGNTNCAEMLMAYDTDNVLYGRTCNPWDMDRTAGGSSGGEAAAVASGMSAAGIGSDGGGSIRVPAHFTGICGLKPTPGRIPGAGHFPACVGPFAHVGVVGPLTRTAEDLRLMLRVTCGADIDDPMAVDYPNVELPLSALRQLHIGYFEDDGGPGTTSETRDSVRAAVRALAEEGIQAEAFLPSVLEEAHKLWETLFVRVAGGMLVGGLAAGQEAEISPQLRKFLHVATSSAPLTAEALLQTLFDRDTVRARFLREMQRYRVIIAPVSTGPAFRHGEGGWDDSYAVNYLRAMRFSQWFNLLGNPAVVIPVGRSAEGLPIGVQIIGRPYEEGLILQVANLLQKHHGWAPPSGVIKPNTGW
jgi:amidase